jgi:signal transduction histidine kinase
MNLLRKILPYLFLLSAAACLLSGWQLEWSAHQPPNIELYTKELQTELKKAEEDIERLWNDGGFLLNATEGILPLDSVKKYNDKKYTILFCNDKDSIVYWNNFNYGLYRSDLKYDTSTFAGVYRVGGSLFLHKRKPYDLLVNGQRKLYTLMALIPVYEQYAVRNDYLKERFPLISGSIADYVKITDQETPFALYDQQGNLLTYLVTKADFPYRPYIWWTFVLYFASSFFLVLALARFAVNAIPNRGEVWAWSFLGLSLLLFRGLSIYFDFPIIAKQLSLFRSPFVSWPWGEGSLGDFLLDVSLLLFWSLFFYQNQPAHPIASPAQPWSRAKVAGLYTLVFALVLGMETLIYTGVFNSNIVLEFEQISQLDRLSFLALLGALGLCAAAFLFLHVLFKRLQAAGSLPWRSYLQVWAGLTVLFVPILYAVWGNAWGLSALAWSFAASLIWAFHGYSRREKTSLLWISIWLLLFSAFIALIFEQNNAAKDAKSRADFAKKMALERDFKLEEKFVELRKEIQEDPFYALYFTNPIFPTLKAQEHSLIRYLDKNFFGRYQYSIHFYQETKPYKAEKRDFQEISSLLNIGQPTLDTALFHCSFLSGSYAYVARIPIRAQGQELGLIVIEWQPKKQNRKSSVYVELLSLPRGQSDLLEETYNYALYKYGRRAVQRGEGFIGHIPYNFERINPNEYRLVSSQKKIYGAYRSANDFLCIVELQTFSWQQLITAFSYIFCIAAAILAASLLLNWLLSLLGWMNPLVEFEISLRERVQRGIVVVTLLSFVAIAIITVFYFQYEYSEYHRQRLKEKISNTAQTVLWQLQTNNDTTFATLDAKRLADIHQIDVNLYDTWGNLIRSSEETIFERRLINKQMHPVAYQQLRTERLPEFIQDEKINNFSYLSAYVPLYNNRKEIVAYVNLPYDLAGNANLRYRDVADFLGALLNVYVIFLLIAGLIAFLISGSIVNPLLVIGEKLNQLKLGQKSERLQWNQKDEIGVLVEQYNQMVEALEQSTLELARSQRESAWRDMAKQVAHEIKNPLTPMKLRLQLLQKLLATNPEQAAKKAESVMSAIIQQIDNLAQIASEFSNFAKMPAPVNELFNLNNLLESVYEVFSEEQGVKVELKLCPQTCMVYADQNQILRVFNNLVKNAIQAIPSDQAGLVQILLRPKDSKTALVEIRDNGEGIPEERKGDIFVPNFTTKSSGSGIGLAMCKNIVKMAQGDIYFESQEGQGTSFFVELPLSSLA